MAPTEYNVQEPWVRQPFDGDLEWALFQDFLTLSGRPRDVRALVRNGAPLTVAQLETLAFNLGWNARAAAWDLHLERVRQTAIEHEIGEDARAIAQRHGLLLRRALNLASKELDKLLKASEMGDGLGLLTPREILRFIDRGVQLERLVSGEVTDRVESTVDLSGLSLEDLRSLQDLQSKVKT